MNMRKLLLRTVIAIVISVNLNACGKNLPDPVERKDGYAWIPIADTAFLIPEKTWLKSYGRKSTDGSVDSFDLHVTAPDVQPWSEAVNEQMYPPAGPGQRIDVVVKDDRELLAFQFERFYVPPQSRWGSRFLCRKCHPNLRRMDCVNFAIQVQKIPCFTNESRMGG